MVHTPLNPNTDQLKRGDFFYGDLSKISKTQALPTRRKTYDILITIPNILPPINSIGDLFEP